ncbi:MAG: hypothetical protein ACLPYB_13985 [Desulfobaccales bacterium]
MAEIKIGILVEKGFAPGEKAQKEARRQGSEDKIVFVDRASHEQFVNNIFSILEKAENE